jgi:anthranilate synthase component 1
LNKQQFEKLSKGDYKRIPVWRTVLADLDTPLSVYLKLADGADSFLFESVEGGETWGRYSIIGLPCKRRYTVRGNEVCIHDFGEEVSSEVVADPLARIEEIRSSINSPVLDELPLFTGGLVGYFGYETVELIEPGIASNKKTDELGTADIVLLQSEEVAVFDNLEGRLWLVINVDPAETDAWAQSQRRLDNLEHRLRSGSTGYGLAVEGEAINEEDFHYGFERDEFIAAVDKSKEYILAGDIFQVVLSQRMSVPFRALRALNPSPYMYFIDLGETQIVGSSPEVLVRVQNRQVTVRPIAGTIHRGANAEEDQALAEELLNDPKECAEHLMLIDLGRNDVGRVAKTGTVEMTDNMVIERYSHVMHIVSQVEGELEQGFSAMDAIRASFPAGTLSGAPKIRAMEIINELEPVKRNIYAGAVGYISWHDDTDLAIAIRTAVIHDGKLHVQAGAGIVADSDAEKEWEETRNKGRALITAVDRASRGL